MTPATAVFLAVLSAACVGTSLWRCLHPSHYLHWHEAVATLLRAASLGLGLLPLLVQRLLEDGVPPHGAMWGSGGAAGTTTATLLLFFASGAHTMALFAYTWSARLRHARAPAAHTDCAAACMHAPVASLLAHPAMRARGHWWRRDVASAGMCRPAPSWVVVTSPQPDPRVSPTHAPGAACAA